MKWCSSYDEECHLNIYQPFVTDVSSFKVKLPPLNHYSYDINVLNICLIFR